MQKYTIEQLKEDEFARAETILDTLAEWSNLYEKMHSDYMSVITKYQEERRQTLKYLGTIAGGAAALAPQLIPYVHQHRIFYLGLLFLLLVVIISITYVLSTVENDTTKAQSDFHNYRQLIYNIRKPKIEYLNGEDKSIEAFAKAMSNAGQTNIPKEDTVVEKKAGWYQPMDYTGEFVVLFTIVGLGFLMLALTQIRFPTLCLILGIILIFIVINVISTFPTKIFSWLGAPIDIIKAIFRSKK